MFFQRKEEAVILYTYEVEATNEFAENEAEPQGSNHCAWCGDPPDQDGSHGICAYHTEQILKQSHARRRKRS